MSKSFKREIRNLTNKQVSAEQDSRHVDIENQDGWQETKKGDKKMEDRAKEAGTARFVVSEGRFSSATRRKRPRRKCAYPPVKLL